MADQAQASNADTATAPEGVNAGGPARQPGDQESTPPDDRETAVDISEEDQKRILEGFGGEHADEPEEEEELDDDEDEDLDDDGDESDEEDDDDPETDRSGDDQPGDEDNESLSDDELDQIEKGLSAEAQKQAFIRLRQERKQAVDKAAELEEAGEFGQRLHQVMEHYGVDEKMFDETLDMLSTINNDPLKGIRVLQAKIGEVAARAKEAYPDFADRIDSMVGDAPAESDVELPDDLQEAVELGTLTLERAKALAKLDRTGEPQAPKSGTAPEPTASEKAEMAGMHQDLLALGYYEGSEAERKKRTDELLIPRAEELAAELNLNLDKCDAGLKRSLIVKAAREVMAKVKAKPSRKRRGKQLRSRDGERPKPRPRGEYKSEEEMRKHVLDGFS
jgi:hypothetical protein